MALSNLNRKLDNYHPNTSKRRSFPFKLLLKIFIILLILGVIFYFPAHNIYQNAKALSISAKKLSASAKTQNLGEMQKDVTEVKAEISSIDGSLNFFFFLRYIPVIGSYYSDGRHFVTAAQDELDAATIALNTLTPYKDELGLNGQPTPGQDKIAQGLKVLDKLNPQMDKIEPKLKAARTEVEPIDTDKYPDNFRSLALKSKLVEVKDLIIGADLALTQGKDLIANAPSILGQDSPKTYLILFQNDKELRATGGFITAYAFLKMDKGHMSTTSSDDIYKLDEKLLATCQNKICPLTPPAPIAKYLPEFDGKPRTAWSLRDSNLSPDLPTSMKQFETMYNLIGNQPSFDGIIMMDTQVVQSLIAITGPIQVFDTTYTADLDKRCNCANVIYELEHYAEVASQVSQPNGAPPAPSDTRKAILGTLMQQILARSLGVGTDKMPQLLQTGINLANSKHLMVYFHDQKVENAFATLNWTGQIKSFDGDYLAVNDSNFAGGKTNLYVTETATLDITANKDGALEHKLTLEYSNPQAFSSWLNTINRDYVRIYVPTGSKLVSSKGSDDPVNTQQDKDLNKTYFEAFITVRPQNSRKLEFDYTVSQKASGSLPMLIQKQPGTKDFHYIVNVNGKKQQEFDLSTDQQFNLNF